MRMLDDFMKNSGFKVLAMARFNQSEYSVLLYLINCAVARIDELVTTKAELASLIGYDIPSMTYALNNLSERKAVRIKYADLHANGDDNAAMRIAINFDIQKWRLNFEEDLTVSDAIVFPFRRLGRTLQVIDNPQEFHRETWQRVLDSFCDNNGVDPDNPLAEKLVEEAKVLVETHPVDQVLLLLRHFKDRVSSLSLLASSWNHYVEMFEHETMKVDFSTARKKHSEQDSLLQKRAREYLDRALVMQLEPEEVSVLKIIINHRHPRRQLFWAYQARTRYPHLMAFFNENEELMLPVTSAGQVVRRPTKPELTPE